MTLKEEKGGFRSFMGSNFKLSTKFVNEFAQGLLLHDPKAPVRVAKVATRKFSPIKL